MPFTYKDCIKRGLLSPIPPSLDKAKLSIQQAEKWLEEAKRTLDSKAYSACIIAAYLIMFHAARSILFRDGFREKSHACLARYLDKLVETNELEQKWVDALDHLREIRHDDQYSLGFFATPEEAVNSIKSSTDFLERIRTLINASK